MGITILAGLLMMVGLVGVVVPMVPGLVLVVLGTVLWAAERGDARAWIVVGVAVALYAAGLVTRYVLPGRRMQQAGVGTMTLLVAVLIALVGFFVVPVAGAPLGFVLGVFLVELARDRDMARAWSTTKSALRGVVTSTGIELVTGFAIVLTWVLGLLILGSGP